MPTNFKQQTPEKAVAEETAKKLTLEKRLKDEMTRVFNEIGRQASNQFRANRTLINTADFQDEIEVILRQHSRRIANKFQKTLRNDSAATAADISQEFSDAINDPDLQAEIAATAAAVLAQQARQSAALITQTNRHALEADLGMATANAVATTPTGQATATAAIAVGLKAIWNRQTAGRVGTIATTETETSAETSKAIETDIINQRNFPGMEIVKMWITVGDERVRDDHIAADRQIKQANEPFIVGGERLQFPKDRSLGASAGNVINCRCIANRFAQRIT